MSEKIPVLLIHRGHDEYVQHAINQAVYCGNEVTIITDREYSNCKVVNIGDFLTMANQFRDIYVPLSTLGDYELFCFQRWFVLYEYMTLNNLLQVFYIDSDVLLYDDVTSDKAYFDNFIFTLILKSVGCCSYFSYIGLSSFCKFLFDIYQNKTSYEFAKIASHFSVRQQHGLAGGVCDMTLFEYFGRYKCANGVGELTFVRDNSTYDHNINDKDTFYEFDGTKKINFYGNHPYCFNKFLNTNVRFKSIHFQGGSKSLIPDYCTYNKQH